MRCEVSYSSISTLNTLNKERNNGNLQYKYNQRSATYTCKLCKSGTILKDSRRTLQTGLA